MADDANDEYRFNFTLPDTGKQKVPANKAVEVEEAQMGHQLNVRGQSNITLFFGRADARSCGGSSAAGSSSQHQMYAGGAATSAAAESIPPLPPLAPMERVRAPKQKLEAGPRGRQKAVKITKETKVPLQQRLKEFPNEFLKISNGVLFCTPCKMKLDNLKEQMKRHFETAKHVTNKEKFVKAGLATNDMRNDIAEHFEQNQDLHGVRVG